MDPAVIATSAFWAGVFAVALAVTLTAPAWCIPPAFLCGAVGRGVRDGSAALGLEINWATALAAAAVVVVATALIRRREAPPVVLICGVLPLGAAIAMFKLIFAVMHASTAAGAKLAEASTVLIASTAQVFATSLAIAVGLGAGLAIRSLFDRDPAGRA